MSVLPFKYDARAMARLWANHRHDAWYRRTLRLIRRAAKRATRARVRAALRAEFSGPGGLAPDLFLRTR